MCKWKKNEEKEIYSLLTFAIFFVFVPETYTFFKDSLVFRHETYDVSNKQKQCNGYRQDYY